jgi:trk system potassium uptake protein TrkH
MGLVALTTIIYLQFTHTFEGHEALLHGIFQVISIATTTGFTTAEYFAWPGFLPVLLLFSSFVGACAGSTGGGMKVIRMLLLYKQGRREIIRLIHPSAQVPVKLGDKAVPERVMNAVWGFFALYIASFTIVMLVLMATGLDQVTAFSAVAACINNLGPGLGDVGANFAQINAPAKWVLCFAMLLGRLEIFTLLVLLTPTFWRK